MKQNIKYAGKNIFLLLQKNCTLVNDVRLKKTKKFKV